MWSFSASDVAAKHEKWGYLSLSQGLTGRGTFRVLQFCDLTVLCCRAATELFKMLNKYRPETKEQKEERLKAKAEAKAAGGAEAQGKKPYFVKCGINHIASLVERKKASMVLIAHDVDPIELVIWLPALCRKMDVPFCIVKGKARLGSVVHKKNATALAFTGVRKEVGLDATLSTYAQQKSSLTCNFQIFLVVIHSCHWQMRVW
jgi:ribosomal protein L7Ae-like RNA K-turn-binding protein